MDICGPCMTVSTWSLTVPRPALTSASTEGVITVTSDQRSVSHAMADVPFTVTKSEPKKAANRHERRAAAAMERKRKKR